MKTFPMPMLPAEALQALERGDYAGAIRLLEAEPARPPESGVPAALAPALGNEAYELVALAYFQAGKYESAALHYAAALELQPHRIDLRDMLALAQANATAAVQVHVPDVHYFDRASLLAAPTMPWNALPSPLPPRPRPGLGGRVRIALGNVLGVVATASVNGITHAWGRFAGYRDAVWTNWYRRGTTLGVVTLAYMRELLNARNLVTTYPHGALTGFQRKGQTPPPGVTHFRTADGTWNDLDDPKQGAAGTRFLRNVAIAAIRPETDTQLLTPNPREISRTLLTRSGPMKEVPFLNLLAGAWIQFMNHDWISHGEIHLDDVIEVPLPENDPARTRYRQEKMVIARTQADPTRMDSREEAAPMSFINEVTHWWDGSQIYGSDQATQDSLRSHVDGKLRVNADGTLPLDNNGVEETGFKRNWWVGLSMLHTLFVGEHNAICDHLKEAYPDWNDNRLFNVARLINAAVMAKIHSVEWTPAILPNPALDKGMNGNWFGLLTNFFRKGKARKTLADIKVRNPELGGLVGNPIDKHGVAFGFSEEFTEVYRLHSLLPETLALRRREGNAAPEQVPFPAARQSGSAKITSRFPLADLFFSFGTQHPGQLVLNNYPRFMQELSIPGIPFLDMGTVDILRARERGVPRYNEFRRQLGLNPIRAFEDLTDDAEHVKKLKQVYGSDPGDVEQLDLLVGTLAEGHRPTGFGFGETLFQIFIVNASRRLQADRFYTDYYNADVYTPEGLRWIDDTDLKTAILRQYPELASTGLANIKNAFEPWDTGELDPERHPLRAFDPELKAAPWRGDAHPPGKARWSILGRLLLLVEGLWSGGAAVAGAFGRLLAEGKEAWRTLFIWPARRSGWNLFAWLKFAGAKPFTIKPPPQTRQVITPVPLGVAIPALPIETILAADPKDIPADERSEKKSFAYKLQVGLYSTVFRPMQPGLPPIDPDPVQALRRAYTWPRRAKFDPPALPAEFLGSPDLGSLAVRGPYACYIERDSDGIYKWDLEGLGRYDHHQGLHKLGATVLFRVNPMRRALEAYEICTTLGSARPGDPTWELSKKLALCAVTTHLSLVRHFNWTHLASAAHLAIATRNRLPADHALCRLLWAYMYGTQQSNDMVTRGQMVRGGDFETIFSFNFDGMCRLFDETYRDFHIVVNDPEQDAKARQIRDAGFDTPTQDNLEALFNVMHEHARHYLGLYYPDTAAIGRDAPILAWLDELNILIPNGVGVSRTNVSFDNLARLIARFIYLVSVQHEILGSFLWNYQLWTHRQPVRVYTNGQREPLDVYQRLVNANFNLNVNRRALMDDFSSLALDGGGKAAFTKFREDLKALQASMERQPWTVWKLYPAALKVNINA